MKPTQMGHDMTANEFRTLYEAAGWVQKGECFDHFHARHPRGHGWVKFSFCAPSDELVTVRWWSGWSFTSQDNTPAEAVEHTLRTLDLLTAAVGEDAATVDLRVDGGDLSVRGELWVYEGRSPDQPKGKYIFSLPYLSAGWAIAMSCLTRPEEAGPLVDYLLEKEF